MSSELVCLCVLFVSFSSYYLETLQPCLKFDEPRRFWLHIFVECRLSNVCILRCVTECLVKEKRIRVNLWLIR